MANDTPYASRHGVRRMRKRVQVPRRATARLLAKVRAEGTTTEQLTGPLRARLHFKEQEYADLGSPTKHRVYQDFIYIFDAVTDSFITVYPVASYLRSDHL